MTNLSDFLKCEKVRCLSNNYNCVEQMKAYRLLGIRVQIVEDSGDVGSYSIDDFEPVLETAIQANTQDNATITQDSDVNTQDKPMFKVGDRVYWGVNSEIYFIDSLHGDLANIAWNDDVESVRIREICHATPENYERLSATFENIEFEAPPKELTGSDLCRAMLDKGWKYVPCYISDSSDEYAINKKDKHIEMIDGISENHPSFFTYCNGGYIQFAVPFDPKTGNVLTSEVLDDQ